MKSKAVLLLTEDLSQKQVPPCFLSVNIEKRPTKLFWQNVELVQLFGIFRLTKCTVVSQQMNFRNTKCCWQLFEVPNFPNLWDFHVADIHSFVSSSSRPQTDRGYFNTVMWDKSMKVNTSPSQNQVMKLSCMHVCFLLVKKSFSNQRSCFWGNVATGYIMR
jgi:hypothetical protein